VRRPPPALVGSESRGVAPDCPQGFAVGCHVLESALAGSSHVAGFSTIRPLAASGSVVGTTPLAGPHVRIGCSQPLQRLILGMCAHLEAPRGGRCFPCGRVRGVRCGASAATAASEGIAAGRARQQRRAVVTRRRKAHQPPTGLLLGRPVTRDGNGLAVRPTHGQHTRRVVRGLASA